MEINELKHLFKKSGVDKRIYNHMLDKWHSILTKSNVQFKLENNGTFYYLEIVFASNNQCPINMLICQNELNVNIGQEKVTYWEDLEINDEKGIKILAKGLKLIFKTKIEERIYKSGEVKFINRDTNELIYYYKNLFPTFRNEVVDSIKYDSWEKN